MSCNESERAEQLLVACGGLSFTLRRISLGKRRQVLEASAGAKAKAHKERKSHINSDSSSQQGRSRLDLTRSRGPEAQGSAQLQRAAAGTLAGFVGGGAGTSGSGAARTFQDKGHRSESTAQHAGTCGLQRTNSSRCSGMPLALLRQ